MSDDWNLNGKEERWGNYLDWHGYESDIIDTLREKLIEDIQKTVGNYTNWYDEIIPDVVTEDIIKIINKRFGV